MDFVQDNPGELVPEETFTYSHLLWSPIIPYLLPPSITIHVQFTCLTVFPPLSKFSLDYFLAWHSPLHTPYISFPNNCLLFAAHAHTITTCFAAVPELSSNPSLSPLYVGLYLLAEHHTSICPLKSDLIFLSYRPGLTSMQHTTLHTTVQSPSHYQ